MKKVFVDGYHANNLGDDLFFKLLLERYPNTCFIFNHSDDDPALLAFPNIKLINVSRSQLLSELREIDVYLLIGGSMFQEVESKKIWIRRWLSLLARSFILKLFRKKIVFIGFNFGPYKTKLFLNLYKILFRFINYLSVRDEFTFKLLKNNKKVKFYPDLVFGLNDDKYQRRVVDKSKSLGISVMDFGANIDFQKEYESMVIEIINGIDSKIPVKLFGFQKSYEIDDSTVINRISGRINKKVKSFQYIGNNTDVFLKEYYDNMLAITTRFHSLVLSLKANQDVISFDYNMKVTNLRHMLHLESSSISIDDILKHSDRKVNMLVDEINDYFSKNEGNNKYINLVELSKAAEKHFEYLDIILGK